MLCSDPRALPFTGTHEDINICEQDFIRSYYSLNKDHSKYQLPPISCEQPAQGRYKKLEKELNKDRRSKEAGPEQKLRTQSGTPTKYGRH